ncbi:MAG: hypothetical protein L6R43_05555 [Planctomycetes bacterium]|nr:hypothetical protein [Planctomycetota bacterium]
MGEEAIALVRQLDKDKKEALRIWKRSMHQNAESGPLARANDYAFKICKDVYFIQLKWFAVNGRYFQGKETMREPPDFREGGQVNLGVGLTDQVDDWFTVGYSDSSAPVQLRCDVYGGPSGQGYAVTARTKVGEDVWRFQMHRGPEEERDAGNLRWTLEPRHEE